MASGGHNRRRRYNRIIPYKITNRMVQFLYNNSGIIKLDDTSFSSNRRKSSGGWNTHEDGVWLAVRLLLYVRCRGRGSTFFPAAQLHCSFISVIFGILVRLFADDPRFTKGKEPDKNAAQGVSVSFPWSVLSFALMWLEFASFSHKKTDSLISLLIVGNSFGCLFGGRVGDILSQRFLNSGRIILAQISSASAIPFDTLLLLALKDDPSTTFAHAVVLSVMGYFISWNGPATNK
ncbi:uncharacterized protein [Rutidosis leptorrhynchoides]|uniref:uncharacterized protein n=1 Tax=Rutidosis leptorrhynchoides TaxID=125765 RepID=UPI003A996EAE